MSCIAQNRNTAIIICTGEQSDQSTYKKLEHAGQGLEESAEDRRNVTRNQTGDLFIYLLKAYTSYSPVNRTWSPQGFLLNKMLQKLNTKITIQTMHILQT